MVENSENDSRLNNNYKTESIASIIALRIPNRINSSDSLKRKTNIRSNSEDGKKQLTPRCTNLKTFVKIWKDTYHTRIKSSPQIDQKKNFIFSKRNFVPRQNHFISKDEQKKVSPFEYYANNYLPARVSPRKNLITMNYYNANEQMQQDKRFGFYENSFSFPHEMNFSSFNGILLLKKDNSNEIKGQLRKNENLSTKSTSPNLSNNEYIQNSSKDIMIPKINYTLNSEDNKIELKRSHFVERQGDWICMRCKNLNFSFRIVCNRCKISKAESDMLYEEHMHNVYNVVRFNEMVQKNFILNQGKISGPNFNPNMFSFNNQFNPSLIPQSYKQK